MTNLLVVELKLCRMCLFFFFFQAEDGIRDLTVTGVQTCALPISRVGLVREVVLVELRRPHELGARDRVPVDRLVLLGDVHDGHRRAARDDADERSEERRVGKEGRSRWSPYH